MLFNKSEYIVFLAVIFLLVIITNRKGLLKIRNALLLIGSYYFYSCLSILFIGLLVYITFINYIGGIFIVKAQEKGRKGKTEVGMTILLSLAILIFLKYAYIYNSSILLPIGLSFFTFQALTYSIDIYRLKVSKEKSFVDFALFISFFPTLLSGPIERSRNLIPQFKEKFPIYSESVIAGIQLFVWGLFKKVVIADRLANYVDEIYVNPTMQSGSTLALAAICYSFQIYADFSGYADMAVGSARILGLRIMENFNLPYCVNTFKEFWRRWHISLTSWFTEYVYISLGGNRVRKAMWVFNISVVFLLSGIWHGATYSFILWGAIHAAYYLIEYYFGPKKPDFFYHLFVFIMITFAWVFFRIADSSEAWNVITAICCNMDAPVYWGSSTFSTILTIVLLIAFFIYEQLEYRKIITHHYPIETVLLTLLIALLGVSNSQFVYFQF